MIRLVRLLRTHRTAIVLALLVSVIVASPQIVFRYDHRGGGVYQGIELLPDNPWPPRVREVMDGHPLLGSPYYKDGKGDPYLFQPLGSIIVASLGWPFGLDYNDTLLLSRFVLSPIVFLLIYAFTYLLVRSRLTSVAAASLLTLGDAATTLSSVRQLLRGIAPSDFLNIGQPVNPALIYIPLFLALIAVWLFFRKKDWRMGALAALLFGLNFYVYFYSWTFLYAFGACLILLHLVFRQWRDAGRMASVLALGLVVAIPYALNLYRAAQYPLYTEVGQRFGLIATHAPIFIGVSALAALLVYGFCFSRGDRPRYLFGLALLLAPILTLNQQILTGREMQAAHYHWYFHKPIALLLILITMLYLLRRFRRPYLHQAFAILVIVASFGVGVFTQADSYLHDRGDGGTTLIARQRYGPVMQWLSAHAEKEAVVLATNDISYLVTIYTPSNVFYHRAAYVSLRATHDRLMDALLTFYRLRGVTAAKARDVIFADREFVSWNLYGIYYRQLYGSVAALPDALVQEVVDRYTASLDTPANAWLRGIMQKYEVNYVVWDMLADPDWRLERYPFLRREAVFGDLAIYRFVP